MRNLVSKEQRREKETCHAQSPTGAHLGAHICIYMCVPHRRIVHRSLYTLDPNITVLHCLICFLVFSLPWAFPFIFTNQFLHPGPLQGLVWPGAILELLFFLFHIPSANITCTPHLLVLLACFVSPLLVCVMHVVWGHQFIDGEESFLLILPCSVFCFIKVSAECGDDSLVFKGHLTVLPRLASN